MKKILPLIFTTCIFAFISCNMGKSYLSNQPKQNHGNVIPPPPAKNTREDRITNPPVPDGCNFRGRWHITNKSDSTMNVYVLMFDCEGTYYVTENGITIKLQKEGNRLYELDGDIVSDDFFEIVNGKLRLGNRTEGDYTEKYGYIITPY